VPAISEVTMHEEHITSDQAMRSDVATAAIIEEALRLCDSEGIDAAIRHMEQHHLDRKTILRVLCSPKFHR
jgi:hypothetical protein